MSSAAWATLATVLGGVLATAGGWVSQTVARRSAQDARRDDRAAQNRLTLSSFERDTLLELQDELYKLNRAAGAITHLDEMRYRETGRWGRDLVGEEWDQESHRAIVAVGRLRVRLFDSQMRADVEAYTSACVRALSPGPVAGVPDEVRRDLSSAAAQDALTRYQDLNEQLGYAIRLTFDRL